MSKHKLLELGSWVRSGAVVGAIACLGAFVACGSDSEPEPGNDAGAPNAGAGGAEEPSAGAGGSSAGTGGSSAGAGGSEGGTPGQAGAGGAGSEPIVLGTATRIDPGSNEYFSLEGPYWVASEGYLLFSDVVENNGADAAQGDPLPAIHLYDPVAETFEEYPYPAADLTSTNGLGVDSTGRLIVTERVNGRLVRVEGTDLIELATTWPATNGDPLSAPNDVVVSSTDNIYFTDTRWGSATPLDDQIPAAAYRVAPNGALTRIFTAESVNAQSVNGIALSPDGSTLYLGSDMDSKVWTLALAANGAPAAGAEPVEFLNASSVPGSRFSVPDGINVDDDGNVYVALNDWSVNAIAVFNSDGEYIGEYEVPVELDDGKDPETDLGGNGPSNISFGGADRKTLFITTHHALWQVQVDIAGKP